jgi:hypothetical protein
MVVSVAWGQGRVSVGQCILIGVDGGEVVDDQRERETLAGFSLGLPSSSSMPNCKRKKEKIYKSLDSRRKSPADPLPSLGRFAKKE